MQKNMQISNNNPSSKYIDITLSVFIAVLSTLSIFVYLLFPADIFLILISLVVFYYYIKLLEVGQIKVHKVSKILIMYTLIIYLGYTMKVLFIYGSAFQKIVKDL